jgi:hypothetical protein
MKGSGGYAPSRLIFNPDFADSVARGGVHVAGAAQFEIVPADAEPAENTSTTEMPSGNTLLIENSLRR